MDNFIDEIRRVQKDPLVQAILAAYKGRVYLVGGSVRDLLLNRYIADYDLVVAGDLESTALRAAETLGVRAIHLGRDPKTVFRLVFDGRILDLCTIEGDDIHADLARRDLTVNALALPLAETGKETELLDPFSGRQDLDNRVARFISEANVLADPVRMLRLFRFSSNLDLTPDAASLDIVRRHADKIRQSAGERLGEEFMHILGAGVAHSTILSMLDTGLLEAMFPEMTSLRSVGQGENHHLDVLNHTMAVLDHLETILSVPDKYWPDHVDEVLDYLSIEGKKRLLKLTVLLHDLGKPASKTEDESGEIHFYGHEITGLEPAGRVMDRLRLGNDVKSFVNLIIRHHLRLFHLLEVTQTSELTPRAVHRLSRDLGDEIWGLIIHSMADAEGTLGPARLEHGGPTAFLELTKTFMAELHRQKERVSGSPPLLNGHDLMDILGIRPGPLLGRILGDIEEARATGRISEKDQAIELARRVFQDLSAKSGGLD